MSTPPIPPNPTDTDCSLSIIEGGNARLAAERAFDAALIEEKLKRGIQVTDEQEIRLRTAVVPSVFLGFIDLNAAAVSRELSDGERRILHHEMTTRLQRELDQ